MNENIQRYYKKTDLPQALRELKGRPVVVFDLETNGLSNRSSVLSCSAFKFSIKGRQQLRRETRPLLPAPLTIPSYSPRQAPCS
ncbi:MAG: hypothetical protein U5P10_02420 [Spirochaetia bacterium]|nr:hypothetical protein [Spirochaetia bacterium]